MASQRAQSAKFLARCHDFCRRWDPQPKILNGMSVNLAEYENVYKASCAVIFLNIFPFIFCISDSN